MSERNHSTTATKSPRSRWITYLLGTGVLVGAAVVGLQFFHASPAASQTSANPPEGAPSTLGARIMAKVNHQAITYDVVAKECVARHGAEILDSLINRLLIQQECERRGVTISRADVEQEVIDTAKKFNLPVDTWYSMLEAERGLNREQYHNDIIWPMIALKKLAGQQVQVTDEDMRIGFERNYGPRVKARMIVVNGNLRQASAVWEKCNAKPEDFDRIAREHSDDPNTRALGGTIPPIQRHGGNDLIEKEAFALAEGEISGVIQVKDAKDRYVILKCEGQTEPVVKNIELVYEDLRNQLMEEATQRAVANVFEDIKDNARIDNYLTNRSTGVRSPVRPASATAAPSDGVKPAVVELPSSN